MVYVTKLDLGLMLVLYLVYFTGETIDKVISWTLCGTLSGVCSYEQMSSDGEDFFDYSVLLKIIVFKCLMLFIIVKFNTFMFKEF